MIQLHKLNGDGFILNASHIEVIDTTPNTVITLSNGKKYVVSESAEEVIRLTTEYKKGIYQSFR
ncbi:MAG: flagellar FlbD family protein [Leptospirales bacterium]|jgi:flagellar protein FlbD|nr:flagellar FlbD family protein [Leptospirales bacterium]